MTIIQIGKYLIEKYPDSNFSKQMSSLINENLESSDVDINNLIIRKAYNLFEDMIKTDKSKEFVDNIMFNRILSEMEYIKRYKEPPPTYASINYFIILLLNLDFIEYSKIDCKYSITSLGFVFSEVVKNISRF